MRYSLDLVAGLLLSLVALHPAQADVQLLKLEDSRLARILAEAVIQEIERPEKASHYLRLYGVGVEGDCVPETHWVCEFDYYLAVSTFGSWPKISVYSLGRIGEIVLVEYKQTNPGYQDTIRLTWANYPATVLKRVRTLQAVRRTTEFNIIEAVVSLVVQQADELDLK